MIDTSFAYKSKCEKKNKCYFSLRTLLDKSSFNRKPQGVSTEPLASASVSVFSIFRNFTHPVYLLLRLSVFFFI